MDEKSELERKLRYEAYKQSGVEYNEKQQRKINKKRYSHQFTSETLELFRLLKEIPDWENHVTDKQAIAIKAYVVYKSSSEADRQLKLTDGTVNHRIFGSPNYGFYGALGKLRKIRNEKEA